MVVTGRSPDPVVLFVDADTVRFDAPPEADLDDVEAVTEALEARYGGGVRVLTVGAAGRRLARIAAMMNDKGRALGRGGGGAVFGSKNLVAVVVAGSVRSRPRRQRRFARRTSRVRSTRPTRSCGSASSPSLPSSSGSSPRWGRPGSSGCSPSTTS